MPNRTREELEQIRKDFEAIREFHDSKFHSHYSGFLENLFNGKSRKEELADYHQYSVDQIEEFYNSGKVKSCEALTLIQQSISEEKYYAEHPRSWEYIQIRTKDIQFTPVGNSDLLFPEAIELLKNDPFNKRLNQVLDEIGIDACIPIACNDLKLDGVEITHDDKASPLISANNLESKLSRFL